jgi:hypothetical protein
MSPMKTKVTKVIAVVRNVVDPRYTNTVTASPKGWEQYKKNYGITPQMIVSVKEVTS